MAKVIELEFFVDCPTTSHIAVKHRLDTIEHLAWMIAAWYHGYYNGNASVENGKIRATIEFKTENQANKVIEKELKSKINPMKSKFPQLKGIRYTIKAVN